MAFILKCNQAIIDKSKTSVKSEQNVQNGVKLKWNKHKALPQVEMIWTGQATVAFDLTEDSPRLRLRLHPH